MTLSFSNLNEIGNLYESIAASDQEQLNEDLNDRIKQGLTSQAMANAFKKSGGFNSPGFKKLGNSGGLENSIKQGLTRQAMANAYNKSSNAQQPSASAATPAATPARTPAPSAAARSTAGAPAKPASSTPTPAKTLPSKPAVPTGTTAGGTTFQRRAATGAELRAAQAARAAGKGEEGAIKASVAASKPAATSTLSAATAAASKPAAFKPVTSTQATSAAPSTSASASGGNAVSAANKIAAASKPVNIKASYEYDVYDLVLEYLLDNGHVDTVEEANYVMMEMDAETIGNIVEARMDPRGRPASGPMNVYAKSKGKPDQAHSDAVKAYDEKQKKKTPEQRKKELDDYKERQMNR
jgi:hypothetical protein